MSFHWLPIRIIKARPRLFLAAAAGVLAGLVLPATWHLETRLLIAWNIATWFYFALAVTLVANASNESMRRRAKITDDGKFAILVLTVIAAIASFGAIVAQLGGVKDMSGLTKGLHVGLAAATIVSAWTFIHLTFALHYAHEYFDEWTRAPDKPAEIRGGLLFPGGDTPDYLDFLYFSFVIGVASQTADIAVTSKPMRRTALAHCVLAFFFNSAVLALTINIAAGLI